MGSMRCNCSRVESGRRVVWALRAKRQLDRNHQLNCPLPPPRSTPIEHQHASPEVLFEAVQEVEG